jgi:hypothetical protein
MAIKVTLGATEKTQQEKPFPKLMISIDYGAVVLFESYGSGTVLIQGKGTRKAFFYYENGFNMGYFTDYNEPITIQNQ